MPKVTREQTNARRDEIINACAQLYETTSFKDLTLKDVGSATSFTRTSIYNYFQTKEEIFLALLEREYDLWNDDLTAISEENERLSADEFADRLARSLEKRERLLKIMSMNHYDLESSSRMENLTRFKRAYGKSLQLVARCVEKFFPDMGADEVQNFIYVFFPFMFGIYPYTNVTEKQREAMKNADADYVFMSVYEIAFSCVKTLLRGR
ncbi:MAG TPA: TetR/AcrR family transcriptional regulator [Candidatus Scatosoma pullicola]|nr:TetR/AcrR family transcriptional regulator [Candidatus Scatosoma pullicola]